MGKAATAKLDRTGCCGVCWRDVLKHQTYGALVVLVAAAIITALSRFFNEPEVRPVQASDPTIGYPLAPHDTVPLVNAAVYPFVALIVTIILVEFGIMHGKQSRTMTVQAVIHIFWMALVGFAVVLSVTEATKPVASRFRPDFLQRCKPDQSITNGNTSEPITNILVHCTGSHDGEVGIEDGRKSFPSGHSSNTLSVCWYCMLYLIHALYFRQGFVYMGGLMKRSANSIWWRLLLELLQGLLIVWACVILSIAWWIGVSRFTDHRHNIDDILGGFIIALLWMTPIALISIAQLHFYHQRIQEAESDSEQQLPQVNSFLSTQYHSMPAPGEQVVVVNGPTASAETVNSFGSARFDSNTLIAEQAAVNVAMVTQPAPPRS